MVPLMGCSVWVLVELPLPLVGLLMTGLPWVVMGWMCLGDWELELVRVWVHFGLV